MPEFSARWIVKKFLWLHIFCFGTLRDVEHSLDFGSRNQWGYGIDMAVFLIDGLDHFLIVCLRNLLKVLNVVSLSLRIVAIASI